MVSGVQIRIYLLPARCQEIHPRHLKWHPGKLHPSYKSRRHKCGQSYLRISLKVWGAPAQTRENPSSRNTNNPSRNPCGLYRHSQNQSRSSQVPIRAFRVSPVRLPPRNRRSALCRSIPRQQTLRGLYLFVFHANIIPQSQAKSQRFSLFRVIAVGHVQSGVPNMQCGGTFRNVALLLSHVCQCAVRFDGQGGTEQT